MKRARIRIRVTTTSSDQHLVTLCEMIVRDLGIDISADVVKAMAWKLLQFYGRRPKRKGRPFARSGRAGALVVKLVAEGTPQAEARKQVARELRLPLSTVATAHRRALKMLHK
jgi:hypothetical protein